MLGPSKDTNQILWQVLLFLQTFYNLDRDSAQPWRIQVQLIVANQKPEEKRSRKQSRRNGVGLQNCLAPLFKYLAPLAVHPAFEFLTSFGHFLVFFPFCPPVIAFAFGFFWYFVLGVGYKSPRTKHCKTSSLLIKLFWRQAFSSSCSFSFSLIFSHFLGSQTPSEDDNLEDEWLETLPP